MKKPSILIGLLLYMALIGFPATDSTPTIEYISEPGLIIIQGNSIQAVSSVYFPDPRVYGVLINQEMDVNELKELIKNEKPLLYRIIECESRWNNICNTQGCDRGMGLAQIIPGTWDHIKTEINIGDDPMNETDNLKAALWLFNNGGVQHWGYPPDDPRGYINGERWGSWDCWGN
jgi:hypothetical protein